MDFLGENCGKVAFLKLGRIVNQLDFFCLKLWRLLVVGNEVIDNFFFGRRNQKSKSIHGKLAQIFGAAIWARHLDLV